MASNFKKVAIDVVKSAITGQPASVPENVDVARLHSFSMRHGVPVLMYYGLTNSMPDETSAGMEQMFLHACQYIALYEYQIQCSQCLIDEFEKQGIDYMPLKGLVIRDMFPRPEMRTMADADILIRDEQYEKIKPILIEQGYEFVKVSGNEYAWRKQDFYLELHRYLLKPEHSDYFELVGDGWKFAERDTDTKFGYHMRDEDFFVFLVVHFAKHYRNSGIGIKHMVDIWVYLTNKPELDLEYVKAQLAKIKLDVFMDNMLKTMRVWFENATPDEVTDLMTSVIFRSGSFGTTEQKNISSAVRDKVNHREKSRFSKMLSKVFLPYANMCLLFPVLKKAPVLLPIFWIWRIINAAFFKKSKLTRHYHAIKSLSKDKIVEYENELNAVGLEYRFEEDDD